MSAVVTICLSALNASLSLCGSLANLLVLLVLFKNSELQKGLNLFIASLGGSDFLICAVIQPMYIFHLNNPKYSLFYTFFDFLALILLHASFNHLAAITFHRMKALGQPYTHRLLVSKSRVVTLLALLWLVSVVMGALVPTKPGKLVTPYVHVAMILSLIAMFIRIFFMVRQHRSKIALQEGAATSTIHSAAIEYQNEAAKTSAILVGSSVVCFLPDVILDLFGLAQQTRAHWGYTLLFASSAFNPFVFIWRSQQFRVALRRTLRGLE